MEAQKREGQESSAATCPPSHTRAGELESVLDFYHNEILLLADAEIENLPVREFKCTRCHCVNTYLEGHERTVEIMTTGRRMMHRDYCINRGCYCHTALGKPVEIKTRVKDWGDVPF